MSIKSTEFILRTEYLWLYYRVKTRTFDDVGVSTIDNDQMSSTPCLASN